MRTVLFVAYHFPPVGGLGAAGSQRALKFVRHLPEAGWRPVVLTVREDSYESYLELDEAMLAGVPADLQIVRTGVFRFLGPVLRLRSAMSRLAGRVFRRRRAAPGSSSPGDVASGDSAESAPPSKSRFQRWKDAFTDLFEIPDEVSGWLLPAVYAGARSIRREQIDVIFATGRPWTSLVIGAVLKCMTGRPLVVDFRDPWMTNPFRIEYSGFRNWAERKLERWVINKADLIVANTDTLRSEFVDRFGEDVEGRCITVLNGFDTSEFARIVPEARPEATRNSYIALHSGFLYGKRDPTSLVDAVGLLKARGQLPKEFICDLVGPTSLPYDLGEYIDKHGLQEQVRLRGPVSYADSLAALAGSDLALLLQPGTTTQVPSKLFEYVGFGRQILAIAPPESAVGDLMRDNDLGAVIDPQDVEGIAEALLVAYNDWRSSDGHRRMSDSVQSRFDVRESVRKLSSEMVGISSTS